MYLHYYVNQLHGGQVDSELIFNFPKGRSLVVVAHNQEKADALEAFKLVYGKDIKVVSPAEAYDLFAQRKLPGDVFVTKKVGQALHWDEREKILCT